LIRDGSQSCRRADEGSSVLAGFSPLPERRRLGNEFEGKEQRFMKTFARRANFLASDEAVTAVEYAVMLAVIVIVCLSAIGSVGIHTRDVFATIANSLGGLVH
jgi:pilus assembly protein Flp/PilA